MGSFTSDIQKVRLEFKYLKMLFDEYDHALLLPSGQAATNRFRRPGLRPFQSRLFVRQDVVNSAAPDRRIDFFLDSIGGVECSHEDHALIKVFVVLGPTVLIALSEELQSRRRRVSQPISRTTKLAFND